MQQAPRGPEVNQAQVDQEVRWDQKAPLASLVQLGSLVHRDLQGHLDQEEKRDVLVREDLMDQQDQQVH